jgi:hypothetical protein
MTPARRWPALVATVIAALSEGLGYSWSVLHFGIMFFTVAILSFVGPRIAAVVADAGGGSFSRAFLIAAAISPVGLALVGAHALLRRRSRLGVTSSPLMTDGPAIEE